MDRKYKTEDNLRQRSTKHTETKENVITVSDAIYEINGKDSSWRLVHYSQLPQWLKDNEFLHNWNRPPLHSFAECFKSVFKLHTETGNIWTHLLGCVAFIFLMIYFMSVSPFTFEEKLFMSAFFVGAILCHGMSTLMHILMPHSDFIFTLFRKLDYCGISCLIMGSMVPWIYFVFYCDYITKLIYISMVVILGIITIISSLSDRFGTPEYRAIRALIFVIFGLSAFIPLGHYISIMDWNEEINITVMQFTFLLAFLYILGAAFYGSTIPEILFPGKYDVWFQSHQIFHVFVVAGALVTYHVLMEISAHRHIHMACPVGI